MVNIRVIAALVVSLTALGCGPGGGVKLRLLVPKDTRLDLGVVVVAARNGQKKVVGQGEEGEGLSFVGDNIVVSSSLVPAWVTVKVPGAAYETRYVESDESEIVWELQALDGLEFGEDYCTGFAPAASTDDSRL